VVSVDPGTLRNVWLSFLVVEPACFLVLWVPTLATIVADVARPRSTGCSVEHGNGDPGDTNGVPGGRDSDIFSACSTGYGVDNIICHITGADVVSIRGA